MIISKQKLQIIISVLKLTFSFAGQERRKIKKHDNNNVTYKVGCKSLLQDYTELVLHSGILWLFLNMHTKTCLSGRLRTSQ